MEIKRLDFHVIEFLDENGGALNKYTYGSKVLDRLSARTNFLCSQTNEEGMKCSSALVYRRPDFKKSKNDRCFRIFCT